MTSEFHEALNRKIATCETNVNRLQGPLQRTWETHLLIKRRLSDKRFDHEDGRLLEEFNNGLREVSLALDNYENIDTDIDHEKIGPALQAAVDAFRLAGRKPE
jgi:hypothetical protein